MFEAFFKNLPFPCCITDLTDIGEVVACNAAMLELAGLAAEDVIGKSFYNLLPGALPEQWGEISDLDTLTFNGRVFKIHWVEANQADRECWALILKDQQAQVEREQRKNDMLNTASHDLKSGLAALTGFLELIANLGTLNDRQGHYLGRVRLGIQELVDLTDRLLDIGWIESGMALELQPLNLADLAQRTADRYSEWAKQQGVKLQLRTETVPPVAADMRRLRQVIANLIGNAIKYSPNGGNVEISVQTGDNGSVEFAVRDEGIGIEQEHLARIFERFYRVPGSETHKIEGSGMGLFISNSILEQHGERLQVESKPGVGSRFWFTLPAVQRPQTDN